jgi:D-alanyl-lipoteichoic acid acyltransferase DltB (MBOAT superfamily)
VSLTFNLTMLGFFKYFSVFADSAADVLHALGMRADYATLNIVLPVGISFYTFITMSYVIDVYRREIAPADRWLSSRCSCRVFRTWSESSVERSSSTSGSEVAR